tara:strand:- start:10618 stop:11901 length:1284 start_codon:yes stop_codon:yes gene_type:complete
MDHPTLDSTLQRLHARIDWEKRGRHDMRVDVAPARDLLQRLGSPHRAWRAIHVAGTKGKGSVAAGIAAGLEASGLRTGLYTSPHVERIHERVRMSFAPIEDAPLASALTRTLDVREQAEVEGTPAGGASWFDLVTCAAFLAFAEANVDVAVVEVGLGGRLDSTNALIPELCVITNIDLEHTDVLGSTRAAIAGEKAGILKAGVDLVHGVTAVAGDDPRKAVEARAAELGIQVLHVPMNGTMHQDNARLARACLDRLGALGWTGSSGRPITSNALTDEVLAAHRLPGRAEFRSLAGVPVVLDGAHVPSSLARLMLELRGRATLPGTPQVVLAVARDKDASGLLKAMGTAVDRVFCTSLDSGIHLGADRLTDLAREARYDGVEEADPVRAVVRACDRAAARGGWVLVTGSLYLVGAVRAALDPPQPSSC